MDHRDTRSFTTSSTREDGMQLSRRSLVTTAGKLGLLAAVFPTALSRVQISAAQTPGGEISIMRSTDALSLHPGINAGLSDIATNFLVYDALVIKDFDGNVQPALAESWETSEDGAVWTFHLRQDVTFHSGEPFTSAHVVDHFTRWQEMPTASKLATLASFEAPDDYTVVFTLTGPNLVFLNNISQTEWAYASIPNMNKVAELGDDYGVVEVDGTGPYILEEWVKDDHMTLVRNENYKLGNPVYENAGPAYPERVTFQVVPEAATRTNLMETGDADMNIDTAPRDVERISSLPGMTVDSFSRISSNNIGFNFQKPLFQDKNVRQAINKALRRDEITQFIMMGQADPAEGYLHPEVQGALPREETSPYLAYDPEGATQLLTDSGWAMGDGDLLHKDGSPLAFTTYVSTEEAEQICQVVQAQLKEIGIDMQVRRLDSAAFSEATQAGEHDARFTPMIYTTADHMYFYETNAIPSPNNLFHSNPAFDELFARSQSTVDQAEQITIFGEMETFILEEAVVVPIQHVRWIFTRDERVQGMRYHNIHGVYKMMDTYVEE
jgi:peptide/nickel transport system substrate-binding protein